MSYRRYISYLVLSFVLINLADCHIRFVCPRPQSPSSTLKKPPCGKGLPLTAFENDFTDVWPGLLTVKLEEPVILQNTPLKLSLLSYDDPSSSCVLLDHIPHNNHAGTIGKTCNSTAYPIGGCNTPTFLTVRIPDINCSKCILQIVQISPEQDKECTYANGKFDCPTYYSCANIKIWPSEDGIDKTISSCSKYFPSLMNYPFAPVAIYWVQLTGEFLGSTAYFYDSNGFLSYKIIISTNSKHISGMALFPQRSGGLPFVNKFKKINTYLYKGTIPYNFTIQRFRANMKRNSCFLRITYPDGIFKTVSFRISFKERLYTENKYSHQGTQYNGNNMLDHVKIVGDEADFRELSMPAGRCKPAGIQTLGAFLQTKYLRPRESRGLIVIKWTGRVMHLYGIIGYRIARDWSVVFKKPEYIGNKRKTIVVNRNLIINNAIEASLPVWQFALFAGGPPTYVETKTTSLHYDATLNKTITAILEKNGVLKGLVILNFISKNWIKIVVAIQSFKALTPAPRNLTINGPATHTTEGPIIYDLLPNLQSKGFANGVWISDGDYPIYDQKIPMHLWNGDLYVNVISTQEKFHLRGQIEPLTNDFCVPANHVACQTCQFGVDGTNLVPAVAPITGRATFHYNIRNSTLETSLYMEGMKSNEVIDKAYFYHRELGKKYIDVSEFTRWENRSNIYNVTTFLEMDVESSQYVKGGLFVLRLEIKQTGQSSFRELECQVPPVREPPKIVITTPTIGKPSTSTTTTTPSTSSSTTRPTVSTPTVPISVTSPTTSTKTISSTSSKAATKKPTKVTTATTASSKTSSTSAKTITSTASTSTTASTASTSRSTVKATQDTRPTLPTTTAGSLPVVAMHYCWLITILATLIVCIEY